MRIIADIVVIAVVAVSAWIGYKNRAIRGICAVLAAIISIYGASVISSAYSGEFSGMFEPFIGGVVDTCASDVINQPKDVELVADPLTEAEKKDPVAVSYAALRQLGIADAAAKRLSETMRDRYDSVSQKLTTGLSKELSEEISFAGLFVICFILIIIVFAVIGNLLDLTFKIPDLKKGDQILGALFGAVRGVILVMTLAIVLRYAGIVIPEQIKEKGLLALLINSNPVARAIGL